MFEKLVQYYNCNTNDTFHLIIAWIIAHISDPLMISLLPFSQNSC